MQYVREDCGCLVMVAHIDMEYYVLAQVVLSSSTNDRWLSSHITSNVLLFVNVQWATVKPFVGPVFTNLATL